MFDVKSFMICVKNRLHVNVGWSREVEQLQQTEGNLDSQ